MSSNPALSLNAEKLGYNDLITGSYGKQIIEQFFFLS